MTMNDLTLQSRLQALQNRDLGQRTESSEQNAGPSFGEVLRNAIQEVNELQADADRQVRGLQLGEDVDIHDVMIAINKMDVSFKMLMEVRNKLLKAYEEVMRMQV